MSESNSTENRFNNIKALFQAMLASLRDYWVQAEKYQQFIYITAAILITSGVFHTGVFLLANEPWAGSVSWRKPIVFGFSFGVTNLSIGWLMTFLPRHRIRGWLLMGTFGIATLFEVFLITMQKWRGVPSHFNFETQFDNSVFGLMGLMVVLVALIIVVLTVWPFFPLKTSPSLVLALRVGLVLLVFGQVIGNLIIANGLSPDTTYETASIIGAAGQMKIPHALFLHAIQILPFLAWLLFFTNWPESRRTKVVIVAAIGYIGLAVVTVLQTYSGLAPIDLSLLTALLLFISVVGISSAYIAALRGLKQTLPQTKS